MRDLLDRLGCLVQLAATVGVAMLLARAGGLSPLWSLGLAVPLGMVVTWALMMGAGLLLDRGGR